MKQAITIFVVVLALTAPGLTQAPNAPAQTRNLEIYWVDVEGGAATLFISPTGESLLFDTGFPGNGDRDAKRIHAASCFRGSRDCQPDQRRRTQCSLRQSGANGAGRP